MENFINWLDKKGLLEYIVEAALIVIGTIAALFAVAWIIVLALAGVVICYLVFAASGWWLLALILWLVLVTITIAAGRYIADKL